MDKKVVLVTGASSGIGKSIIEKFAKNGYNCVLNYVSNQKEAENIKNRLEQKYKIKCLTIKADVSNETEVKNMFIKTIEEFNRIDTLVNNAGIALDTTFDMKTKENFMKTYEINTYGVFNTSRVFGDYMFKQKHGNIINISSTNAIDSYYEFSLDYDASKAGVISLSHNLANHYSPYIRVNTICPGWVNTPMNDELLEEFKQKELDKILLNRFAEPEEIANLVYFLSTEEASYINDSVIKIDGGRKC